MHLHSKIENSLSEHVLRMANPTAFYAVHVNEPLTRIIIA